MADIKQEIERRRTFAIISHPDAGKTTLTEKFLLYGGAIQSAGAVKGKSSDRHATSDWMEIEKKRGISVTSSVMQFEYEGFCINILDTPGHQDFSEDTYRTLMAADSAVMVIDGAKGIEPQTRKLFKVCAMRHIPIFTFINKMDREARDPFDLIDELEKEFGIGTYPINWPIGCGVEFKGVYERDRQSILTFDEHHAGRKRLKGIECDINDTDKLDELIGERAREILTEQVELLDGACFDFDIEKVRCGQLSPVFFGSALNNFGVEAFLERFLEMTSAPLAHKSVHPAAEPTEISPFDEPFSAFVFKIQANMNKAHRDRIAFMRICSGKFERGEEYFHVQAGKPVKLAQPQQMMAQEREIIDTAYAGDIIGVFDPGIFSIGDTICAKGAKIPQEGAIQIFFEPGTGMERVIVGVVGVLQFDVLEFRMESEYGVKYHKRDTPHQLIRYIDNDPAELNPASLRLMQNTKWVQDVRGRNLLVFVGDYEIDWALDKNPGLRLSDFHQNM